MITEAIVCLALNIYHEARGEPLDGQLAVAAVTLNRVESPRWPDDVCDVVYDPHQFSWTTNPPPITDPDAFTLALRIAQDAQPDPDMGTYYHTTSITPYWAADGVRLGQVGDHIFYADVP